jgi:beta-xylosidase
MMKDVARSAEPFFVSNEEESREMQVAAAAAVLAASMSSSLMMSLKYAKKPQTAPASRPASKTSSKSSTSTTAPAASKSSGGTYANPVMDNCADPASIREGNTYYVMGTGRGAFDIFASENLKDWRRVGSTGGLTCGACWAPDLLKIGGKFYLSYTDGNDFTSSVAVSDKVTGPYQTILNKGVPGIDLSLYAHTDGRVYGFYNPIKRGAIMACCKLSKDLTKMEETKDLFSGPIPALNQKEMTVEAPFVVRVGNLLYMMFSVNATGPNYNLSYATASDPMGPWKQSNENLLPDDKTGHGHNSMIQTPKGTWICVYHGAGGNNMRNLCVDKLTIANGKLKMDYSAPGVQKPLIT